MTTKTSAQQGAEADVEEFRNDRGPFVVAAETTRMAMVFTDIEPGHPIIFANDSFLALTGFSRDEILGKSFNEFLDDDAVGHIEKVFKEQSSGQIEACVVCKDESRFWAAVLANPVRNSEGDVVQYFASLVDINEHKEEEKRLHFLLDELNHRTQNTLATVQAIATQTLRGFAEPEVVTAFEGRLMALSKAHSLLGRENWDAISLTDVITQIMLPFGLDDGIAPRCSLDGDDVALSAKFALTFAMLLHELATNAAKYGALSNATGHTFIRWSRSGDDMQFVWEETGGPPVTPPTRKGFGSRLIERGLARELNGVVDQQYLPTGLVCQITMPYPGVTK